MIFVAYEKKNPTTKKRDIAPFKVNGPSIWGTFIKLVTKYQISAIKLLRKISWKDGRTDRQTEVKQYTPLRGAGV
jgi:hypothetical protein